MSIEIEKQRSNSNFFLFLALLINIRSYAKKSFFFQTKHWFKAICISFYLIHVHWYSMRIQWEMNVLTIYLKPQKCTWWPFKTAGQKLIAQMLLLLKIYNIGVIKSLYNGTIWQVKTSIYFYSLIFIIMQIIYLSLNQALD